MSTLLFIEPTLELIWLISMVLLSVLIMFKKKSVIVIIGCILITAAYIILARENVISYQEVETARWISRIGISCVVFSAVTNAPFYSPIERLKDVINKVKAFFNHKNKELK